MLHYLETERKALAIVERLTGVKEMEIKDQDRRRRVVEARSAYAYILRICGLSYVDIGEFLKKDHSTVIHLVRLFQKNQFRDSLDHIIAQEFGSSYPQNPQGL